MYPLPVVLVGIDEDIRGDVRLGLAGISAELENEFASVGAAIEGLRHCKTPPRLLIVGVTPESDAANIRRLHGALVGSPILALVSVEDVDEIFLRVNRAGAAQVVPVPLDRDDFHSALNMIGSQFGGIALDRHVFAVTAATGGSGSTTIALNLAAEIAHQLRRPTILAELTLQMGALASLLDVTPRVTLTHLIKEIRRVDDLLVEKTLISVADGLKILAGPDKMHSLPSLEPGDLVKIVDCLKNLAEVTVLDMPGTFHAAEFEVLNASDQLILIGLQSVPSIRALKLFRESLPEERVTHSLMVVINRYNSSVKGLNSIDIQQMLRVPRILTVANDYNAVNLSANQGRPLRQVAPSSPILGDLDDIIREILKLDKPDPQRLRNGLVRRVLKTIIG